jgi:uncharacterized protein
VARFFYILIAAIVLPLTALADSNQLAGEASPYLRQHATDPVHWRAWTDKNLAAAKKLGRPILLSIGYSACHWCHVMQRESFTDPATAKQINAQFFPILIDREQRPDLDAMFQSTAVLLELPTGWPLTVFLTPEGRTFFTGTYYPNGPRQGMPGFTNVLERVAAAYAKDPDGARDNAKFIQTTMAQVHRPRPGEILSAHRALAAAAFMDEADTLAGGFGNGAKFPQWVALSFLWRHYLRTGSAVAGSHVRASIDEMIDGGLFDHVGGGFFRHTVDPLWRVPHFEKMLDVNAGLLRLITEVWRETKSPKLAEAARRTIAFLERDMRLAGGGFAASLDADSIDTNGEEREGAYYRWHADELTTALGTNTKTFTSVYSIAPIEAVPGADEGDPERGNLYRTGATTLLVDLETLRRARAKQHAPQRDNKLVADWAGQAIAALAEAGQVFNKPAWTRQSRDAFAAAQRALVDSNGRLRQSAFEKQWGPLATLAGLAAMADGAISLFEATGEQAYLVRAVAWAIDIETHHGDTTAPGFFDSAADAEAVPVRLKSIIDDPNPSGNARAVEIAARLYYHTGEDRWRQMAETTLRAHGRVAGHPQLGIAGLLNAADTLQLALQVVIIGKRGKPDTDALVAGVMARSLPAQVLQVVSPGTVLPESHPARYKEQIDTKATVYVCRGTICSLPATEVAELDATLLEMRRQ